MTTFPATEPDTAAADAVLPGRKETESLPWEFARIPAGRPSPRDVDTAYDAEPARQKEGVGR
ncbi:hypothetical protein ABZ672_54635 [Streptomyces mirabilis]|uniref:hypothetical protein n=1 Tax=Streptomyces mirabilis TaxID=68239 RepID=UPI0034008992